MNLAQMISYIESNEKTISVETLTNEDFGNYLFLRLTYLTGNNVANQEAVCILVENRNTESEIAYIKGAMPSYMNPVADTTFNDKVITAIEAERTNDTTIEKYTIDNVDTINEIAQITFYIFDAATSEVSISKAVAYIDNTDTVKLRKIKV